MFTPRLKESRSCSINTIEMKKPATNPSLSIRSGVQANQCQNLLVGVFEL